MRIPLNAPLKTGINSMKTLIRTALLLSPFIFAGSGYAQTVPAADVQPYRIISKPKPTYTDRARTKNVEGTVLLKVTLLATGEIGPIEDVTKKNQSRLKKYGLVDKAIEAARQIKFTPKVVNGVPVSVVVKISYGFEIY